MKFLVLAIVILSLYLIYRLVFSNEDRKSQVRETSISNLPDDYEVVIKNRFVLPVQSNSEKHEDKKENPDLQDKKPNIFATGNTNRDTAVIPTKDFSEVFSEDVNPEDLDIEKDENETDADEDLEIDEEVEELRQNMGEIEGYADGFTYDELRTTLNDADKQSEGMTKAAIETLRNISKTDIFEKLVSSNEGRAARIASILDRNEQSFLNSDSPMDDENKEYQKFDIKQFLS